MTDKQPTALFLAEQMEDGRWQGMNDLLAAAELRRLHERETELAARLGETIPALEEAADELDRLHEENEALRTALAQTDEQIGITYEEANPPEPYCNRCGKKLGSEVTDIHTCTPKQPEEKLFTEAQVVDIVQKLSDSAALNSVPIGWVKKKEWVGLTDEEVKILATQGRTDFSRPMYNEFYSAIEAKLKDKNT